MVTSVDFLSVKLAYSCLRSSAVPHCVSKFRPLFGDLYWSTTWSQVHVTLFDRHVADFSWTLAHGIVLTADRLRSFFRMSHDPPDCFCGAALETAGHLFFNCPTPDSECFGFSAVFVSPRCSVCSVSVMCCLVLTLPSSRLSLWSGA